MSINQEEEHSLKLFAPISLRWRINLTGIFIIVMFTAILFSWILPRLSDDKQAERRGRLKAVVNSHVSLMNYYEHALRSEAWKTDPSMPRTVDEASNGYCVGLHS